MIARRLVSLLLARIAHGTLVVVEGGGSVRRRFGSGPPIATLEFRSPRVWRMLLRGSRGLADAYEQGLIETPDLVAVIRLAARNAAGLDRIREVLGPLLAPARWLSAVLRRSTRRRSRRDIAAHYDLGNQLFSLMLDSTLSY